MGTSLQPLEHAQRLIGIHRFLQHRVPHHHRGIGSEHQVAGHAESLLSRQTLHVVHRRLELPPDLGDVGRRHLHRNAQHLQQLPPPG